MLNQLRKNDPSRFRHRISIWTKAKRKNELKQTIYDDVELKSIYANITPQTGSLQKQQADTILSNVTHKIEVRYNAGKDITPEMFIMFRGKRFDISYILNPYFENETLEIFCKEVIE